MTRRALISLVAVGVLLVAAAVAWACTPEANINGGNLGSAPPGGTISGWGSQFEPGAPVTVTWSETGRVVFQGHANSNGAVPISFAIPQGTPAGDNTVVAETTTRDGDTFTPRAYFRVTPPARSSPTSGAGQTSAQTGTRGTTNAPAVGGGSRPAGPGPGGRSPGSGGGNHPVGPGSGGGSPGSAGTVFQGLTPVTRSAASSVQHKLPAGLPTRTALVSYAPAHELQRVKLTRPAARAAVRPLPVLAYGARSAGAGFPWLAVALGGLGLLLVAGGGGGLVLSRRAPSRPPEDPARVAAMEAELQELIAEERSRKREPISRS
jgi:hypothetical protein